MLHQKGEIGIAEKITWIVNALTGTPPMAA
jgi:hypothetical protein